MLVALALAAAAPAATAIDAERAFAADAQKVGQWTAFKAWSAPDALMFTPQPVKAHAFLKGRKNPPASVYWWPGKSFVSCDGNVAVNSGPWVRGFGKTIGYFTTVWIKQPDGRWKWSYDAGDELGRARAEGGEIEPVAASCGGRKTAPRGYGVPASFVEPVKFGSGESPDHTLAWVWAVDARGARQFVVQQWIGDEWRVVLHDRVAAPPQ
jgi:hypothetical protein